MSYEHDVFVSYRRQEPIRTWVTKYFVPELRNWLSALIGPCSVFLDEDTIEHGASFSPALEHALMRSKVMVPIWAPGYFYSTWCIAELKTMFEREKSIGFRTSSDPRVLVAPIRFSDGKTFPKSLAGDIKLLDFYDYALTAPGWTQTALYVDFQTAIKSLAKGLEEMLSDAPDWSNSSPVVLPGAVMAEVLAPPPNSRPRL